MKKIAAYLKFLVLALGLQASGSWPLYAGAPMKINFQGRLEESGQPAEGVKNFVFKIYDAASGGSLVWTSQTQSLTLSKGVFSAVLSAGSPADLSTTTFSAARHVEITIDGVPLSPRQEMVSAPYALVAQALAADAQLPSSSLSDASVTDAKVVLTTAAISSGRFGDDRVIITTGAFAGGFNSAYRLVQLDVNGKLPALDGSALSNVTAVGVAASQVADGALGTGVIASSAAAGMVHTGAIRAGAVTDEKVTLTTAAVSSGRFGDDRVIITTGAFTGGFNTAGKVVQLDINGKLPVLDGSALTNIVGSQVDLSTVTEAIEVKLSSGLNSGYVFVGSAANRAAPVQLSGDVTMDNAGATAIGAAKVKLSMLNSDIVALDAAGKLGAIDSSHFASLDGSALTALNPSNLSAAVGLAKGGSGADLSATGGPNQVVRQNSAGGVFTVGALAAGDIPSLDAAKITTGKFNDNMLAISTGAFAGGFNGAGQLVALDGTGKLPAADGSLLTGLNPVNLGSAVANDKGGTGQDSSAWTGFARVSAGSWSAAALAAGDIPSLDASKITTGKFNDHMLSISTGAFPGGFNGADQLAKLDASGRLGISTGTVNSTLTVGGSVSLPIRRITNADTPYSVSENDYTILADATGGDITVTLPAAAAGAGRVYTIKRISASGTITIASAGGQIDGAASQIMNTLMGESMLLQSDGTAWFILFWYWQ